MVSARQCRHLVSMFEAAAIECLTWVATQRKRENYENSSFPATHHCFTPPLRGIASDFLVETYIAKSRGMGLLYGENCMILTSTVFD